MSKCLKEGRQVGRKVKSWGHRAGPAGLHSWALGSKLTQPFLLFSGLSSLWRPSRFFPFFLGCRHLLERHHFFDAINMVFVYYMSFSAICSGQNLAHFSSDGISMAEQLSQNMMGPGAENACPNMQSEDDQSRVLQAQGVFRSFFKSIISLPAIE